MPWRVGKEIPMTSTRRTTSDIELASTEELIAELFERRTLAGALVYSPDEHRKAGQVHNDFRVRTTLTDEATIYLLTRALEVLKRG